MEIYCGTDIIEVARIKDAIDNTKGFKENIYSAREIADIDALIQEKEAFIEGYYNEAEGFEEMSFDD